VDRRCRRATACSGRCRDSLCARRRPRIAGTRSWGILAIAGIYLSPIPTLDYDRHLFNEKELRSVTANTRADREELLKIAGEIPIRTHTFEMDLNDTNRARTMLKHDELKGAAILRVA
jgi:alcohol dehydrogenase, propanol-preferring